MTATCQLIFHMKFEMNEIHLQLQGRNRMAELVRDYCIVLIEILCCKIFFDTFCETGEGKQRKTWLVPMHVWTAYSCKGSSDYWHHYLTYVLE